MYGPSSVWPLSIICNAPALLEECTSLSFPMPRSQHDPKVVLTVSLCFVTLCTCRIRIEGGHTSGTPSAVMYHHPRLVLGVFAGKSASGRHYTTMLLACYLPRHFPSTCERGTGWKMPWALDSDGGGARVLGQTERRGAATATAAATSPV